MEASTPPQFWLFQARPDRYDLTHELEPGREETWQVDRNYRRIQPGDVVYFWQTGPESALHGWGEIAGEPYRDTSAAPDQRRYLVRLVYQVAFAEPLTRQQLLDQQRLADLKHLQRGSQGTAFSVTRDEALALNQFIRDHHLDAPPDPTAESDLPPSLVPLELLSKFSLSKGAQQIVDSAQSQKEHFSPDPVPLTTSGLLLATLQLGRDEPDPPESAQFLSEQISYGMRQGRILSVVANVEEAQKGYYSREVSSAAQATMKMESAAEPSPPQTMTVYVLGVLETAETIAWQTTSAETIHSRHLLAALLTHRPDEGPTGAHKRLQELGADTEEIQQAFLDFVKERYPEDNGQAWDTSLQTTAPQLELRLPGYSPDSTSGEDYLDIDDEVNAVALLISSRSASPPLSIGLFGDWGSGKTFFMRRLQQRVSQIAEKARHSKELQKDLPLYKQVVQIEFNAWHYVEGDLWASLVAHILDNLRLSKEEPMDLIEKRQAYWFEQLQLEETVKREANLEVQRLRQELAQTQETLDDLRQKQQDASERLAGLSQENILKSAVLNDAVRDEVISTLQEVESASQIDSTVNAAKELQAALLETRTVVERGSKLLTPLIYAKKQERQVRWLWLVLALIAVPVASWIIGWLTSLVGTEQFSDISSFFGGLVTLIGAGAAWIRNQTKWVSDWLGKAERANQKIEQQIAAQQAENTRQIVEVEGELERLQADYGAAQRKEEEAQRRVKEIEAELAQTNASRLLARFIQDRAESDDYRRHLGLAAVIRRDFEQLSRFIELENDRLETFTELPQEEKDQEVRINRIVLYIDDLDRCPPHKVVEVLQAVHLLLAFPLFVVVVGVDARWISRSLRQHYKELLQHDGRSRVGPGRLDYGREATPHDYLEKIFQIPLWLEPIGEDGSLKMLNGLLAKDLAPIRERVAAGAETTTPRTERPTPAEAPLSHGDGQPVTEEMEADRGGQAQEPVDTGQVPASASQQDATPATTGQEIDLNPESLTIQQKELDFMKQLTPLLNRSPRSVKRFVNTYRLIKAGLSQAEQGIFVDGEGPSSDFQAVLFLLAVVTEMPSLSKPLFQTVIRGHQENQKQTGNTEALPDDAKVPTRDFSWVKDQLEADETDDAPDPVSLRQLDRWLTLEGNEAWQTAELATLVKWAPRVARYSFRIERL